MTRGFPPLFSFAFFNWACARADTSTLVIPSMRSHRILDEIASEMGDLRIVLSQVPASRRIDIIKWGYQRVDRRLEFGFTGYPLDHDEYDTSLCWSQVAPGQIFAWATDGYYFQRYPHRDVIVWAPLSEPLAFRVIPDILESDPFPPPSPQKQNRAVAMDA